MKNFEKIMKEYLPGGESKDIIKSMYDHHKKLGIKITEEIARDLGLIIENFQLALISKRVLET